MTILPFVSDPGQALLAICDIDNRHLYIGIVGHGVAFSVAAAVAGLVDFGLLDGPYMEGISSLLPGNIGGIQSRALEVVYMEA